MHYLLSVFNVGSCLTSIHCMCSLEKVMHEDPCWCVAGFGLSSLGASIHHSPCSWTARGVNLVARTKAVSTINRPWNVWFSTGEARKEKRVEEEIMDEGKERLRAKVLREKDFRGFFRASKEADVLAGLTLLIHHFKLTRSRGNVSFCLACV